MKCNTHLEFRTKPYTARVTIKITGFGIGQLLQSDSFLTRSNPGTSYFVNMPLDKTFFTKYEFREKIYEVPLKFKYVQNISIKSI